MLMAKGLGSQVSLFSSCAKHHSTISTSHWPWLTTYEAGTAQRCSVCLIKPMGISSTIEDSS